MLQDVCSFMGCNQVSPNSGFAERIVIFLPSPWSDSTNFQDAYTPEIEIMTIYSYFKFFCSYV